MQAKTSFKRMEAVLINKSSSTQEEEQWSAILNPSSYIWMPSLDNLKTVTKKNGGNRNVVPGDNTTKLMDCEEIKQNSYKKLTQQDHL